MGAGSLTGPHSSRVQLGEVRCMHPVGAGARRARAHGAHTSICAHGLHPGFRRRGMVLCGSRVQQLAIHALACSPDMGSSSLDPEP